MFYREYDVSLQISEHWEEAIFANSMLLPSGEKELAKYFLNFPSY